MSNFRKEVHAGGTSEESAFLITNTRTSGKNSHNESARRKWGGLYAKKLIQLIVIWKYDFDAITEFRLAITVYFDPTDWFLAGQH